MASEQDQDGWNDATNTFRSQDYTMKGTGWDDENTPQVEESTEDDPESTENLARKHLKERERERDVEDPFDYNPWIAALPMPAVKEI